MNERRESGKLSTSGQVSHTLMKLEYGLVSPSNQK